jgi:hypothetical protein
LHKQEKVADVHDENTKVIFLGCPAPVISYGIKGGRTDDGSNDHLGYLSNRNPFGIEPLWFAFDGHQKVVKVHDGVDTVIDAGINQTGWTVGDKCEPGAQQYGDMVVPVQQH